MNDANKWRLELAERIAASYARNPKSKAIMIAGSVGRLSADKFSDIEIDVYYSEPPTESERISMVEGCGGTLILLDEDEDEWEEQMQFNGFPAHTSTFLVDTVGKYITQVVDRCEIAPLAQVRLHSLMHSRPVKGEDLIKTWRGKCRSYPDGLVLAMLSHYLCFQDFWKKKESLLGREDHPALYGILVEVERRILGALHGLNRIYLPSPDHLKRLDEMIGFMRIKPNNLGRRLRSVFQMDPPSGVGEIEKIIYELLNLIEGSLPNFDTTPLRARSKGGASWERSPLPP